MNEEVKTKQGTNSTIDNIASVLLNKRSRSLIFLVATFIFILLANGMLPLISGRAHYTADPVELTYAEYLVAKAEDPLRDLTYGSKLDIILYKELYRLANPDMTPDEIVLLEPPLNLKVSMYTIFFFDSPWWYFDTGLSLVSALLLFYALFNYLVIRSKERNIDYLNGEGVIKQLNESYLDPDTFEPWVEVDFNQTRKRKQHIRNTKFKLKKLELKTPYEVRRKFKDYFQVKPKNNESSFYPVVYTPMTPAETKYINKKDELLAQLEENYIKEYIVENDVENCQEIKPGFVYSGINIEGVGQDEYSTIKTDRQRIRSSIVAKLFISLAVTLSFASVLTILSISISQQNPVWVVATILMKLLPLFLQVYFAIDYSNWFMDNQLLPNLKFRENIALLYLAEMKRRGIVSGNIVLNRIYITSPERRNKKNETKN